MLSGKRIVALPDQCESGAPSVGTNYVRAVMRGGAAPVILPYTASEAVLRDMLAPCSTLLLTGGGDDVSPLLYGAETSAKCGPINQRRDELEYRLLEAAMEMQIPVWGICRGIQVINAYFGGTLYQDLPSEYMRPHDKPSVQHSAPQCRYGVAHEISIVPGTRLHQLLGIERTGVNSTHHQAVRQVAPGFTVSAYADDGVIEAIECPERRVYGVQFHPERLAVGPDELFTRIFQRLG